MLGGSWLSLLKYWTARFTGCDGRLAWVLSEYGKPSRDSAPNLQIHLKRPCSDEDNGMVMNQTVTGTVETAILTVKIIHTEVADGKVIEVKVIVTGEEGENGIQTHNITNRAIYPQPQFPDPNHY